MANVTKRGGTYRIRVSAGYDCTGKQIFKSITWKPTQGMTARQIQKELERQKVLFEEQVKSGRYVQKDMRFSAFAELWLREYAQNQLKAKTINQYEFLLKRINAAFGSMRLDRIQPHHLLAFYDQLAADGVRQKISYRCIIDFKQYLQNRNITKVQLSKAADVGLSTLDAVTNGKNISSQTVEKLCDALDERKENIFEAVTTATTLSSRTIAHHHKLLSSIFSTAVQWQLIASNPCDRVKPPKIEKTAPVYLDEKQTIKILELLEQEDILHRTMVELLIFLGLRRGELLGLQWKDIDMKNNLVSIKRNIQYLPERGIYEDTTKTQGSERVIKAPTHIISVLGDYRRWQNEQRLKAGDRWQDTGFIFTRWDGTVLHPDNITSWFHKFIQKTDLPQIHVHSLRHTNATLQIAGGVPYTTVAQRLGHANASTTMRIYAHAIKSADEAAADTIQNMLIKKA